MYQVTNAIQRFETYVDTHFNKPIANWLDKHPITDTIVFVANHIFRMATMYAFMTVIPGSFAVKCSISLAGGLFYLITVEKRYCSLRFAIPACYGAAAFHLSLPALANIVNGVALENLPSTALGVVPFALYLLRIVYLSYNQVHRDKDLGQTPVAPAKKPSCCNG